mmetsp:Transcript_29165/g.40940  ORF Transcript_29165/g.40940 Transcript_29165/m.40940 type:complete len:250 (-) Transcript_29165:57-806(-)
MDLLNELAETGQLPGISQEEKKNMANFIDGKISFAEAFPGNPTVANGAVGANKCANTGCVDVGTKKCAKCREARYCGKDCQKAHWKVHKTECGKQETVAAPNIHALLANLESGSNSQWHTGIKRRRVYERFVMSFQLRVEDEYTMGGNLVGTYGEQAGGGRPASEQFTSYYQRAKSKGMLPIDWTEKDETKLFSFAAENICYAIEKSDVTKRFGYASGEHLVLRSTAQSILGPIGNWLSDNDESDDDEW